MNDQYIKSILQNSSMSNFEISPNSGSKRYAVNNQDGVGNNIQISPSLEELQKKFFGPDKTDEPDTIKIDLDKFNFAPSDTNSDTDDVDIKIVKNKNEEGSDFLNLNERAVIFSKNEGLLGAEG